ncbi:hypothetical protein CsSME_00051803 [Camellia sinensis var. sinensis]
MLNKHGTYPSRCATSDRRQWKIAPGLKGGEATESCPWFEWRFTTACSNGKLPLVWDGAAAIRRQSSLAVVKLSDTEMRKTVTTHIWTQSPWERGRLDFEMKSKPLHGLRRL